jgi:mannose-6-phosphate isomerase-like protein (cupin superfamily)
VSCLIPWPQLQWRNKSSGKTMALNVVGQQYTRPWGWYKTIEMLPGFQVKVIEVNPGGRLSLQSHEQRSEHWVVVKGTATVTVDANTRDYKVNEAIYIPLKAKHRLENLTATPVQIVEVQVGDYLGEDDIQRYNDIYGRIK